MRDKAASWLRRVAWCIEGRPDRRGPMERAQDAAQNPVVRRRLVFVAWVSGVIVGEFLLPATSPLGQVMRGAGYEQQAPGSLGPEQQCRWIAAGRKALGEQSAELPSDPILAPQSPQPVLTPALKYHIMQKHLTAD